MNKKTINLIKNLTLKNVYICYCLQDEIQSFDLYLLKYKDYLKENNKSIDLTIKNLLNNK